MFLAAVRENEADERIAFVTDMTTVVGSLFSKSNPAKKHIGLLKDVSAGVKEHGG